MAGGFSLEILIPPKKPTTHIAKLPRFIIKILQNLISCIERATFHLFGTLALQSKDNEARQGFVYPLRKSWIYAPSFMASSRAKQTPPSFLSITVRVGFGGAVGIVALHPAKLVAIPISRIVFQLVAFMLLCLLLALTCRPLQVFHQSGQQVKQALDHFTLSTALIRP